MLIQSKIKAVAFDLGETLVFYPGISLSWAKYYPQALELIGSRCNRNLTDLQMRVGCDILRKYNTREIPRVEEVSADVIFDELLAAWGLEAPGYLEIAIDTFFLYFQRDSRPYKETQAVFSALRTMGILTGLLTDVPYGMPKKFVDYDLERAQIQEMLNVVLTSRDVGFRKPHTAPYDALAKAFNLTPDAMIYVGNERKDIEGANKAGVISVLIDREEKGDDFGQKITISSLEEILSIIS